MRQPCLCRSLAPGVAVGYFLSVLLRSPKDLERFFMDLPALVAALRETMPPVLRWSGAVAQRLREFNISLDGKQSGSSNTDALTLADLTVQELVVAALRDGSPLFRQCAIKAEESTGDLERFASKAEYTLCLDPIDGTKQFRDRDGEGWSVMLHVQSETDVHYSLVYIPGGGTEGRWVEATPEEIRAGDDDHSRPATDHLQSLTPQPTPSRPGSKKIYMIGFQQHDRAKAELVTAAGLEGVPADETPGSIYDLMATGTFGGSLIHSPNIYDFPVSLQIARQFGGDAVWVHNREPVHFRETWMDDRADMLRLPGIVACSPDPKVLDVLCDVARDWNPIRYAE